MTRTTWLRRSIVTVSAIGALVVPAACGAEASGDVHPGPAGPDAVQLVARDNEFEPAQVEVPAGHDVEIEVTNE